MLVVQDKLRSLPEAQMIIDCSKFDLEQIAIYSRDIEIYDDVETFDPEKCGHVRRLS